MSCSILLDIRPDRRRIHRWPTMRKMFVQLCRREKEQWGVQLITLNVLSIYALARLHNGNSANWKQRDHLLMIGWSCCYRCINSWGDDRSGCMRVPVHSMIVDETLEVMWNYIMIFALDKCNDVVMGSWCIMVMSMYRSSFQCGGIPVIPLELCVRSEWDAFVISRDCLFGVRHVLVKTMHFHVYHCDSVIGSW